MAKAARPQSPEPGHRVRSVSALWNRMTKTVKVIVVVVVPAVGFVAAVVALYDRLFPASDDEIRLVTSAAAVVLSSSDLKNDLKNQVIVGDEVIVDGAVVASSPIFIVANHVDFGESGRIKAPEITIFSTRVTGGLLDVSGADADASTTRGANAGDIFVAAARIDRTRFRATGGTGANGRNGMDGPPGREGDCAGFGNWRSARRGGDGAPGEDGGDGGNGGTVTLLVWATDGFPDPNVDGGNGGEPGQGGRGGSGGTGCIGLGGAQGDQPSGRNGIDGDPGTDGAEGVAVVREIRLREVSNLIKEAHETGPSLSNVRQTLIYSSR